LVILSTYQYMKSRIFAASFILLASIAPSVQATEEPSAIPYRCEDSTVTTIGYYFEGDPQSGIYAGFQSKLGVETFKGKASRVVDRSMPLNSVMDAQLVGDKVQVCLISVPESTGGCNPAKDYRGRVYRVYNYRLKSAYIGNNASHLCGGA
jgi:ribosomal protein L21E